MPFLLFWLWCFQSNDAIAVDYVETVTVVNLPLKVSRHGLAYRDLELEDLRLMENGIAVAPRALSIDETPLTAHFLFDLSTSNERRLLQAKRAARELTESMRPGDRAKISCFSRVYQALTDYTDDAEALARALDRLTPVGSTALYDGLAGALDELSAASGPRALIVFSDGHDLISHTAEDALLDRARNYAIPIVFVAFSGAKKRSPLLAAQIDFMKRLAATSGGAAVFDVSDYARAVNRSLRGLRTRYTLSYVPPDPANLEQWRSVAITVEDCRECRLEYRRAYQLKELTAAR